MATELNELRLQIERLQYDNKEGTIMLDSVKEQNVELTNEIEELRVSTSGCYKVLVSLYNLFRRGQSMSSKFPSGASPRRARTRRRLRRWLPLWATSRVSVSSDYSRLAR